MGDGSTNLFGIVIPSINPAAIGIPLIVRALLWHPLARQPDIPHGVSP
jgi:hypothetical protein